MMEPGNVALFADDVNQALRPRGARRRPREAAPVCSVLEGGVE
jgi:hypothetical protein